MGNWNAALFAITALVIIGGSVSCGGDSGGLSEYEQLMELRRANAQGAALGYVASKPEELFEVLIPLFEDSDTEKSWESMSEAYQYFLVQARVEGVVSGSIGYDVLNRGKGVVRLDVGIDVPLGMQPLYSVDDAVVLVRVERIDEVNYVARGMELKKADSPGLIILPGGRPMFIP